MSDRTRVFKDAEDGDLRVTVKGDGTVYIDQPEEESRCYGHCCAGLDVTLTAEILEFIRSGGGR